MPPTARAALLLAAALSSAVAGAAAIPDEDFGYVTVRPGAHSFYWLYGAAAPVARDTAPLALWLQGGPGASSTGFGNLAELGPRALLPNGTTVPRATSWVQLANLLFLDNPVGAGYSYVDDAALLATNNSQIAADIVTFLTALVAKYPAFSTAPFHVFCESYGGKMSAGLSAALLAALDRGQLKMNFAGVALGDSWISPIDYVDTWAPYLIATNLMDSTDAATVAPATAACDTAVAAGEWVAATNAWGAMESAIGGVTAGANWYNILAYGVDEPVVGRGGPAAPPLSPLAARAAPPGADLQVLARAYQRTVAAPYGQRLGDYLSDYMNGAARAHFNARGAVIPAGVTWGGQSDAVFSALSGDFMRPVVDVVDGLLASGKLNVTVYNGQLDLICCTLGTERWMARLKWPGMAAFYATPKVRAAARPGTRARLPQLTGLGSYPSPCLPPCLPSPQVPVALPGGGGVPGAFKKTANNGLALWLVLQAGHMVPSDQGAMALAMVKDILGV